MAFRVVSANMCRRALLKPVSKVPCDNKKGSVRQSSIFVEPPVPWLGKPSCVFSWEALKHHWGALPVIAISALGVACETIALARLAVTRDDVWFTKNPAACEIVETRANYKVPVRKLLVYNQKYENPPGLVEAMQGDVNGPPYEKVDTIKEEEPEQSSSGVNKKILAAHAVLGAGVIYLAMIV